MKIINKILLYCVYIGLFIVPFIPFVVSTTMYFPFITGKGFFFRILIEIVFGLYVLLAAALPEYRPKMSWVTKAVGVFVLATLIADLFGANPYKSLWSNYERMEGFVLIFHLALYYIVASSLFRSIARWNQYFMASIAASVLMSGYGLLQLTGHATINQGGVRLDATFGNSAYLAIYLVFHIFFSLYMLVRSSRSWEKWTYAAIALFETIILYFTATRGAILGLIGGLILAGLIVALKERENKTLRKAGYGVIIGVLVLVGGFFLIRNTSFVQKSPVLSRFASLSTTELRTQGRYFVWPMALKGIAERPVFGWGQENFNFVFNKYYDPRMYNQEQWFDRTHDIVLDWLIAGGIVGFAAYASMYVALLYSVWRKRSPLSRTEKSIFTGMIAAYIFHNIFVFDNLVSYIIFFSLLGYAHVVATSGETETAPASAFRTRTLSPTVFQYVAIPVVALVVGFSVYFINVPAMEASRMLILAMTPQGAIDKNFAQFKQVFDYNSFGSSEALEQLLQISSQLASAQVPDSVKAEFFDYSKEKITEKLAATPNDARYYIFAGSFMNRFGRYDEAMPYLRRAIELSPRKQSMYFELGSSYLGKQDFPNALAQFKTAYDLEPASPEAKIIYAVGAIYARDGKLVQQLLSGVNQDTIIADNRVLRAYADIGDYQTVIALLTARIQKDPTNQQYQLSLASAYIQIGQKQKAISIIQAMITANPAFKEQGEAYIKQIQQS